MKTMQRNTLMFSLAAALALPTAAMAADVATDEHSSHHPAPTTATQPQATTAADMQPLRERMQEMRRTRDPAKRMQMMETQMKQMDTVMKNMDATCPMAGRQPGGMGMMGQGMSGGDGMMEKRMDMMQMNVGEPQGSAEKPAK
jgi:TolA-binding protein